MNFASLEGRRDGREQREPGKGRRGRAGQTAGRGWNGFLCRLREMDFLNLHARTLGTTINETVQTIGS